MFGKIIEISEVFNVEGGSSWHKLDGYRVKTEGHEFLVLISNGQCCCEHWGYMTSDDNLPFYIGAELLSVKATDTALNKAKVDEEAPYGFDCGGIQFVDFETDKGTFQLAVYNAHNGYYGHTVRLVKDGEVLISEGL